MFTYQKTNRFFAQLPHGIEELGQKELEELGAKEVKKVYRGLYFQADKATLYRTNYQARLVSRITAPLLKFDCHSTKYLYKTAKKLPWHNLIDKNGTFIISATTSHSKIKHSLYAAQCLKDAIADYFMEKFNSRPSICKKNPDLWLDLYIDKNKALISLNTSGESLHKRSYRIESVEAPMQELLAATIVRLSQWDEKMPLIDPMCGSGTLISEAVMRYCKIPSAFNHKRFGFMTMPDFDKQIWKKVKEEADKQIRFLPQGLITGSDKDTGAIKATGKNLKSIPHGRNVSLKVTPYEKIKSINNTIIICNPPYGVRLMKNDDIATFMEMFGNFLKRKCTGSTAYLYLGKKELLKKVGLKPAWKKPLINGGLDGVLAKYTLY